MLFDNGKVKWHSTETKTVNWDPAGCALEKLVVWNACLKLIVFILLTLIPVHSHGKMFKGVQIYEIWSTENGALSYLP